MKLQNPEKKFYPANKSAVCADMKKISLEKIADVLENLNGEVEVDERIGLKARRGVDVGGLRKIINKFKARQNRIPYI